MIGVPFNIASYALLTMMVAQCVNMVPGMFIHTHGDSHIYAPHLEGARAQLKRTPHKLPIMKINPKVKDIDGFCIDDFELVEYTHDTPIKFDIAI
jgi:thymidylate synthase